MSMRVIRFGAVGGVNTLIDFGILNLLMWVTGITGGSGLVLCNAAAFAAASLNSYFMNKGWTFGDESKVSPAQYALFLAFSGGGLAVNSGVLYLLTALPVAEEFSPILWANGAKAGATAASMVWNFLTYRRYVFVGDGGKEGEGRSAVQCRIVTSRQTP
jgi:putative flippase GtrA